MDAVFGTKTLERVSEASDDVEEGQPVVVVLDDDFHQVIEVVKSFREVLGCSWKDAFDYTTQIGTKGAAEVFRGTAEECEKIRAVLAEKPHKLDARVGTKGDAQQMGQDKQAAQEQANSERAVLEAVWGTKTFKNGARPRVTVVGGTGRVGAWTIREL
jgi:ribosomal protein L7/L12